MPVQFLHVRSVGITEPVVFRGSPFLFQLGQPRSRNIHQRVLFAGVRGEVILAGHRGVHEFQVNVLADSLQIAVVPVFEGECGSFSAALVRGTLVVPSGRMLVYAVGRPPHDVDPAAVGFPPGQSCGKMLVGVRDAAIMLFLERVLGRIGIGIAPLPEGLDELLAFFVGLEVKKGVALFGGYDVNDVFVEPSLVL